MKNEWVIAGVLALAIIAASERASADLYRCPMPDGKDVFTDREGACPGAVSHTISVDVQTYASPPAAVAPGPPRPRSPLQPQTNPQPGFWREKKRSSEIELGELQEKREHLDKYVTHCNRRHKILGVNEAGLRYEISCKNIRQEYAQVKTRLTELQRYLDEELEEECRRAGCQPGWIR